MLVRKLIFAALRMHCVKGQFVLVTGSTRGIVFAIARALHAAGATVGIRVNAISPGLIETDTSAVLPEKTRQSVPIALGRFGLGRFGRADEVAAAVMLPLFTGADCITGLILGVNGGLS
jgi:NAD(P)-dependent dehydrogenase (short-subunit alcohol dehydrogenase family)